MKKQFIKMLVTLLVGSMLLATTGCGKNEPDNDEAYETDVEKASKKKEKKKKKAQKEEEIEEIIPEDTQTPVQKFWDGDWFGYMWIANADGGLSEWENCYWDAMATIDVDENGAADMLFWYEGLSRENPAGRVQLTISENSGSGEMGAAISESGWIFVDSDTGNGDIGHADWIIDPMTDPTSVKFGNDMIHFYGEYVEGDGNMDYHFFLRKWGSTWDDVAQDEEELIPRGYDIWYMPLIAEGYAMPNNIGDEGTVKMGDDTAVSATPAAPSATADAQSNSNASDKQETSGGYTGGDLLLVDDDYCTITVKGTGSNPSNDAWIGYMMEIVNKTDYTLYFTSYAEPDLNSQTISSLGKGNTCFYNGERTKTHMGYNVKGGKTISDACLAIDGITDVSQLGNINGYISVSNNDTGEVLNNVPYSF